MHFLSSLLSENNISVLMLFISTLLLAYFHFYFKPNEYHRMVKKFESMSEQQFLTARKTYARLSMASSQAYRDVELKRIIRNNNLDENEQYVWLRECKSSN
jgi:regulator of sigma D